MVLSSDVADVFLILADNIFFVLADKTHFFNVTTLHYGLL